MRIAAPLHHRMIEEKLWHLSTADRRHLMELLLSINRGFDATKAPAASVRRAREVVVRAAQ
jgi:hypothetical protein